MLAARAALELVLRRPFIRAAVPSSMRRSLSTSVDLGHAIHMVRSYDPVGYLPGRLLPTQDMRDTYYAVRSFWVETGLRFGTTAKVSPNSSPLEHLKWWQEGVDQLYSAQGLGEGWNVHPTFRLLKELTTKHTLTMRHFDDILKGRENDLDLKQYPTLQSLVDHAGLSCGSLSQLVLESANVTSPVSYDAASSVGVCHGLTNALRLSIPIISTTGKLIIPEDLCQKYGVRSPRYLLSSLGLGDEDCRRALQSAVGDIANEARCHLAGARALRSELLENKEDGAKSLAVLLPGLSSETFLNRLERFGFDLTNRDLRNVGWVEHAVCTSRMVSAYFQQKF